MSKLTTKLKITLGILTLVAGFLVVRVAAFVNSSVKNATTANISNTLNQKATQPDDPLDGDTDGDGLSDRDEIIYGTDPYSKDTDGDGYIDGEEVASNFDPLDPDSSVRTGKLAVADLSSANLTNRLLELGIASIINNTGEIDPEQMTGQQFASIMQTINDDALIALTSTPLDDKAIIITNDNSEESIKKYLNTVSQILEEGIFSSPSRTITGSFNTIPGLDSGGQNFYENKYNALKIIEVPSSWKEIHKKTLQNLKILSNATRSLTDIGIEEDPVKASFALNALEQSFLSFHDLLNEANSLAKRQKITVQDSILGLLQSVKTN